MTRSQPGTGDDVRAVALAICKSRTCEGVSCCQWPANEGRTNCNAKKGAYDDAARAAIAVLSSDVAVSPAKPVEIRKQNDAIDEIIIKGGTVHIEQMSSDGWFMGVDGADGSYWQFWFGSKNRKSHVEFRHTEMSTAEENAQRRASLVPRPTRGTGA